MNSVKTISKCCTALLCGHPHHPNLKPICPMDPNAPNIDKPDLKGQSCRIKESLKEGCA